MELNSERRTVDSGCSLLAAAGNRDDLPFFGEILADKMVFSVGNDDVALFIDAEMLGAVERDDLLRVAAIATRVRALSS